MVRNFSTLAKQVKAKNPMNTATFDWSRPATGWKHKAVIQALREAGLSHETLPDGCQLGVIAKATGTPMAIHVDKQRNCRALQPVQMSWLER